MDKGNCEGSTSDNGEEHLKSDAGEGDRGMDLSQSGKAGHENGLAAREDTSGSTSSHSSSFSAVLCIQRGCPAIGGGDGTTDMGGVNQLAFEPNHFHVFERRDRSRLGPLLRVGRSRTAACWTLYCT